jgi:four helix bundle protein
MGTVEEEADETVYWMELLIDAEIVKRSLISDLLKEADEILSIVVTSIKTARGFKRPLRNPQSET